jgi:ABC-type lipoprotein release transport system permease subunit
MINRGMRSVGFVARVQLRGRWRSFVVLTLVIGIVGGIALSLIAGSSRSASVVDRFVSRATHYDLAIYKQSGILPRATVLAIPGVRRADPAAYLAIMASIPDGSMSGLINGNAVDMTTLDRTFRLVAGRVPDGHDPFAVLVNEVFTREFKVAVGDDIATRMFSNADYNDIVTGVYRPTGPRYRFHIAGVVRTSGDIAGDEIRSPRPNSPYGAANFMLIPFSFLTGYSKHFLQFGNGYDVQLRNVARDRAGVEAAAKRLSASVGAPFYSLRRAPFDIPVNLESTVLLVLGVATAIAVAVMAALLLSTEERVHRRDRRALRALGQTRQQLGLGAAVRAAPVAIFATVLMLAVAIIASSLYPIGVGRKLEFNPGVQVNLSVLLLGALATGAFVLGIAFVVGWRESRATTGQLRKATVSHWLARLNAPTDVVLGTHLAFDRGRTSSTVPARGAVAGGAIALAVIVGIGVFVGSGNYLYADPVAHGFPWDVMIGNVNFPMTQATTDKIIADPRIRNRTPASDGRATIDGRPVEVLAIKLGGTAPPVIRSGRLPQSASEIALGPKLADQLHVSIGSKVSFTVAHGDFKDNGHPKDIAQTVVGISLIPSLSGSDFGDVAAVTLDAIKASGGQPVTPRVVFIQVNGHDPAATVKAISASYTTEMITDMIPALVVSLHDVRGPSQLGALLAALLGSVLMAYTLAIGSRSRDLAVLRALGMSARRVTRVLVWRGVMLALAILTIGIPLGLITGSLIWRTIANQIAVPNHPVVANSLAFFAPVVLALSIACSLVVARRIRHENVARLLRAE